MILRPSGTEPKLKVYYFAVAAQEAAAEQLRKAMTEDVAQAMERFGIL